MQPPSVEVRYRGLSVLSRMTVGDRSLPTLKKTLKRQAEVRAGMDQGREFSCKTLKFCTWVVPRLESCHASLYSARGGRVPLGTRTVRGCHAVCWAPGSMHCRAARRALPAGPLTDLQHGCCPLPPSAAGAAQAGPRP